MREQKAAAFSGNTSATPLEVTTVSFAGAVGAVMVKNSDDTNDLQVSFDDGTTYYTLDAGESVSLQDYQRSSIKVRASVASVAYKGLYVNASI